MLGGELTAAAVLWRGDALRRRRVREEGSGREEVEVCKRNAAVFAVAAVLCRGVRGAAKGLCDCWM